MTIVHLLAGAGGMYCGSCMQGNTLAMALREAGEDVLLVPVYTPIRTDDEDASIDRVVFGGINVYLQQHSALFRHTPWFLDRLLDNPGLLRWLSRRGLSTRPEQLGPLTLSMLRGDEGRQAKEVDKLVRWLAREVRPELVHLSNVLLVGVARRLARELSVPVVCSLSGEDTFLDGIPEPHYSEARAVLRERCGELSALVAMSRYYADFMAEYLAVPRERIHVIPPGLNLAGHGTRPGAEAPAGLEPSQEKPVTIGYLSRIAPEKGLHQLAEAFKLLDDQEGLPPTRLLAAGYLDAADRPYLDRIRSQLADWGLADRFEYAGEPDRTGKISFLQSLDVMSVPTMQAESKGLAVLEAWANAVPLVLPDHGAFRELIEDTSGGLLHEPHRPPALAAALRRMILDRAFARECGLRAQEAVRDRYHAPLSARRTMELYRTLAARAE
ncbi:MAG TPA: glycosyltransferase family 4 protein [Thermoguttaceae bacterium]|nr:glycosyltransferase family 4 protein [Thermoguttaceae bacterium]